MEWNIPHDHLEMIKRLENGRFGEVWKGLWNEEAVVAVKMCNMDVKAARFLCEAELLKSLYHKNIIQLYGVCEQEPHYIVLEYMIKGNLLDYLRSESTSFATLIDMCSQVACGMAYLESQNCIHRDLIARNILLGVNGICKISSFELAYIETNSIDNDKEKLPIKWTAPEAILYHCFSVKSDVWSFGILLHEVVTYGKNPYPGLTNNEVIIRLAQRYRMPCPSSCPQKFYGIMLDCWSEEPANRPTFETLQWKLEEYFSADETGYCEPAS